MGKEWTWRDSTGDYIREKNKEADEALVKDVLKNPTSKEQPRREVREIKYNEAQVQ